MPKTETCLVDWMPCEGCRVRIFDVGNGCGTIELEKDGLMYTFADLPNVALLKYEGVTLRDQLAMAALSSVGGLGEELTFARAAYRMADAMLEARKGE